MVEAAAAGACPLVPNRLSYPELLPGECLYQSSGELVERLCALLVDRAARAELSAAASARAAAFDWAEVAPRYDELLADMAKSRDV